MYKKDFDTRRSQSSEGEVPRRRVLKFLATLFGGAVALTSGRSLLSEPNRVSAAAVLPTGYPAPKYLPRDYQLVEVYANRTDGFGGSDERALWYSNPKNLQGFNNPLAVYVTRQPKRSSLVAMRQGSPIALNLASGASVQADYHDGLWMRDPSASNVPLSNQIQLRDGSGVLVWVTSNAHSLTFNMGGFTVGIRGARMAGVERNELIRVASSLG